MTGWAELGVVQEHRGEHLREAEHWRLMSVLREARKARLHRGGGLSGGLQTGVSRCVGAWRRTG